MAALALADVLKDFGGPKRTVGPSPVADSIKTPPMPAMPTEPIGNRIDEAVEAARLEVTARLEAAHAAEIEALKQSHQQEIDSIRAEIGEQAGSVVASRFDEMERRLVELTSAVTARILGIALTEDVQAKALDALAKSINGAARDREAVRIRVHGPLSLFEALQPKLGKLADQVEYTEASGFDITAAIEDTLFETRLSEWSTSLSEIME